MDCRLVGRWRIVEADLWDRDYLDLVAPATMTIGADGHGEIAYGAMQASLDLEYSRSTVFFTWAGFDEMDDVSGSGAADRHQRQQATGGILIVTLSPSQTPVERADGDPMAPAELAGQRS
jgi:hypothetical protein